MHPAQRRVAVGDVEQHAVGQRLDALAVTGAQLGGEAFGRGGVLTRREAQLGDLARGVRRDQLRGEPSATMRPVSMTTSRSHSCSASSM